VHRSSDGDTFGVYLRLGGIALDHMIYGGIYWWSIVSSTMSMAADLGSAVQRGSATSA
jgi:hypothetical protein